MELLWLERSARADHIEVIERDMEDLQRDIKDINYGRDGGYLLGALDYAKDEAITCN